MDFYFYRLKLLEPAQRSLFSDSFRRPEFLREILSGILQDELRIGHMWMLGNVESLDKSGFYLRIGRSTKQSIETYKDGRFTDAEFDVSPYTHLLLDVDLELCAIAQQAKVSPSTKTIASSFAKLLERSDQNEKIGIEFKIDPLNDPEEFLEALRLAYEVKNFSFTVSRPNPFDVNRWVVAPLQETLRQTQGISGKVLLKGPEMDASALEDITRSVAATGEEASASIVVEKDSKPVKKKLSGNSASAKAEKLDSHDSKLALLNDIRLQYEEIRNGTQN